MSDRELFVLMLRPEPGVAGLQALRLALKALLRNHGLRCLRVEIALGDDPPLLEERAQKSGCKFRYSCTEKLCWWRQIARRQAGGR
jgi:hypothetical protein